MYTYMCICIIEREMVIIMNVTIIVLLWDDLGIWHIMGNVGSTRIEKWSDPCPTKSSQLAYITFNMS